MADYTALANRLLEANLYGTRHGIQLVFVTEEASEMTLELAEDMKNPYGMAHGGVLFTLMDTAAGVLSRVDGRRYVTLNGDIHYLQSSLSGRIRAAAQIRRRGRSTAIIETVATSEDGTELASATFTMYCLDQDKKPFETV